MYNWSSFMNDSEKSRDQLISELKELRQKVTELEKPNFEKSDLNILDDRQRFRELAELLPQIIYETDLQGMLSFVNKQGLEAFEYTKEEIERGFSLLKIIAPEDLERAKDNISRTLSGQKTERSEYSVIRKSGSKFKIQGYSSVILKNNKPVGLRGIAIDISELKKTEELLKESEIRYRNLFEKSKDAILIIENEKFVDCNQATVDMLGYAKKEDILQSHPSELSPERQPDGRNSMEKADEMMRIAIEKGSNRFEWDHKKANGEIFPVEVLLTPIINDKGSRIIHTVWRDITNRKIAAEEKAKLESQLRHSQKMETIGTLAGGIAHDFNNLLSPILGYADMVLEEIPKNDPLYKKIFAIFTAGKRAKELVQQILLFSRQLEQEHKPLELQLVIKETLKLLRPTLPSTIRIKYDIDPKCKKVNADISQLHQVIMNLCTNAFHAMEDTGGILTIGLKQIRPTTKQLKVHKQLKDIDYALLSVSDTGSGMNPKIMERIFEPFFTTKNIAKGTGLGLSVVHGIVFSHHGEIIVDSKEKKGTTFSVYLPIIDKKTIKEMEKEKEIKTMGHENLLLVDDEDMIVEMFELMLAREGYNVTSCTSSSQALKIFRESPKKFDLVISDFTMPEMTGLELAEKILSLRPNIPFILNSGYAEDLTPDIQKKFNIKKVLTKPVLSNELTSSIRKILDEDL